MWSAHWRKTVSQVTSVWLKGSRQGVHNFERGSCLSVFSDTPSGEKKGLADSVANPFIRLLPSPPVSSPDSFLLFASSKGSGSSFCTTLLMLHQSGKWETYLCPWDDSCPSLKKRQRLRASRALSSYWLQRASLVLPPADSTLWRLLLSHLLYSGLGGEKKAFHMISPVQQALGDFVIILWISVVSLIQEAPKDF